MNSCNYNESSIFRPVFVVGNSRSGTTMMGRIIGKSKEVFTFNELHFFEQLWSHEIETKPLKRREAKTLCAKLLSIERDGYLKKRQPEKYYQEAEKILFKDYSGLRYPSEVYKETLQYETNRHGKKRPCEQTPRNVFYIGEILNLYPDAKIIFMVRDPRDVLFSQKNKWKRRFLGAHNIPFSEAFRARINYHPITISKLWHSSISAADGYSTNSNLLTVLFEKLITKPEKTIKKICDFIDISYTLDLLNIPQIGSSHGQDRSGKTGINLERIKRWQNNKGLSQCEIYWCQKINGKLMKRFGYKLKPVSAEPIQKFLGLLVLPFQLFFAFLLNLRRMKNIVSTVKKRIQY